MNFNDKLEFLCASCGITKTALLADLGISRGNVARWKDGGEPKLLTQFAIASELKMPNDIFSYDDLEFKAMVANALFQNKVDNDINQILAPEVTATPPLVVVPAPKAPSTPSAVPATNSGDTKAYNLNKEEELVLRMYRKLSESQRVDVRFYLSNAVLDKLEEEDKQ